MEVGFGYGALCDPLKDQAKEQGFDLKNADVLEKLRDALNLLRIHSILTDSQCDKAYPRLQKKVLKNLKPLNPQKEE